MGKSGGGCPVLLGADGRADVRGGKRGEIGVFAFRFLIYVVKTTEFRYVRRHNGAETGIFTFRISFYVVKTTEFDSAAADIAA